MHARPDLTLAGYVTSSQFWFESLQNWQSEFFSIAAMVWLAIEWRHAQPRQRQCVNHVRGFEPTLARETGAEPQQAGFFVSMRVAIDYAFHALGLRIRP